MEMRKFLAPFSAFQTIKVKPPERKPTMMFFEGRVPFLEGIYAGFPFWPVPWIE
jgi:hypothetical protein